MAVVLAACTQSTLLHHSEPVDEDGWSRTDTLQYNLPTIPEDGNYQIQVGLRYDVRFPYQGLWIVAEVSLHHPMAYHCDTLYFKTADEEGHFIGTGLNLLQTEIKLTTLHLQKGQSGKIRLHHIMQREVLPSIKDVGVKLSVKSEAS